MINTLSKTPSDITIEQVKKNLQLLHNEDDEYIQSLLDAAISWIETKIGSVLISENQLNEFELGSLRYFNIYYNNISEITSIKINDELITDYRVNYEQFKAMIIFNNSIQIDEIEINFKSGFPTIPVYIRQAIIMKASDLYDNERGNYTFNVNNNKAIERLLNLIN